MESGSDWRRAVSGDLTNHHVNLNILDITEAAQKEKALQDIKLL